MAEKGIHWSEDPYWQEGEELYQDLRSAGVTSIRIDLEQLERLVYDGGGPAYKTLEAMISVHQQENCSGFKGAPRILLALLAKLNEGRKA